MRPWVHKFRHCRYSPISRSYYVVESDAIEIAPNLDKMNIHYLHYQLYAVVIVRIFKVWIPELADRNVLCSQRDVVNKTLTNDTCSTQWQSLWVYLQEVWPNVRLLIVRVSLFQRQHPQGTYTTSLRLTLLYFNFAPAAKEGRRVSFSIKFVVI